DVRDPRGRQGQRSSRQEASGLLIPVQPLPQTGPTPVFRAGHQIGSQGIAFDIPPDAVEVLVPFYRERLEAALVNVARAGGMVVRVPAHAMGVRQPAAEVT